MNDMTVENTSLLMVTLFCSFVSLGAVVCGIVGNVWYINNLFKFGLWKYCCGSSCLVRKNLFQFDDVDMKMNCGNARQLDIILLLLVFSTIFCLLAMFSAFLMFCCSKNVAAWRCGSLSIAISSMLAALASLSALSYNEYVGKKLNEKYDHGWSNIIVWIGGGMQFITSALAYFLICATPVRVTQGQINVLPYQQNYAYEMH